jgi:hypothetical protein
VTNLSGAPLYGRLLAVPTNIRLGWKDLSGTNTLAYCEKEQLTTVKSFVVEASGFRFYFEVNFTRLQ